MLRAIVLLLLLGGWAGLALCLHVVRTPEKFVVVPKNQVGWQLTYTDIRPWTIEDAEQSEVARRLIELGKINHLAHIDGLADPIDVRRAFPRQFNDALDRGFLAEPDGAVE